MKSQKDQYIKEVLKECCFPYKKKQDLRRDLQEIFDSAMEHGETEEEVIKRLGSPQSFCTELEERIGQKRISRKKGQSFLISLFLFLFSICCFIFLGVLQIQKLPENVIGYADSMTAITVENGFSPLIPLLILGTAALICAIVYFFKALSQK